MKESTDSGAGQDSSSRHKKPRVGLQRSKRPFGDRASADFANLEVSPNFQPINSSAKASRDDYEVAMTGPAAFMDPAPKKIHPVKKVENSQGAGSPASVESVVANSDIAVEETSPQRSKLPIYAAIAASLVGVAVIGANSWPSATATSNGEANGEVREFKTSQSAAFGSVAGLPTQVIEQQGANASGNNVVYESATTSSIIDPTSSEATHVAIAVPTDLGGSALAIAPPQPVTAQPSIQALATPKAEFTPLKSGISNVPEEYEGLSRSDCAARFKTVALSGSINFESGSAILLRSSQPILNFFGAVFTHCRHFTIEIAGHTDSVGSANMNQRLSKKRAESVVDYLVSIGVPNKNLRAIGYGEKEPIASNDTALKRSRNRRIEFTVSDG